MELFTKIANSFQPSTIVTKNSILDSSSFLKYWNLSKNQEALKNISQKDVRDDLPTANLKC